MADVIQYGTRPKPADLKAEDIVPMRSLGAYGSDYLVSLGFGSNRAGRAETMARSIGMQPSFLVKYPAFTALLASLAGGASGAGLAAGLMPDDFSKTQKRLFSTGLTFGGASLATLLAAALRRHKMEAISRKFDEAQDINPSFRKAPPHHFLGGAHAAGRLMAVRKMLGLPDSELSKTQKAMYAAYSIPYVDAVTLPVMNVVEHVKSHAEAEQLPVLENAAGNDEFNSDESSDEKAAYWRGFKDRLEKRAVTLEQLRAANQAAMRTGKLFRNFKAVEEGLSARPEGSPNIEKALIALRRLRLGPKRLAKLKKIRAAQAADQTYKAVVSPPQAYKDFNKSLAQLGKPTDETYEIANRMGLKHEFDELRYNNPNSLFGFLGHGSPAVILQEHNVLRSLQQRPDQVQLLRDMFEIIRGNPITLEGLRIGRTGDASIRNIRAAIPDFKFGISPRVSRHFIKNIERSPSFTDLVGASKLDPRLV